MNVVHLRVPPLRERLEDILWYARRFLRELARSEEDRRSSSRQERRARC